MMNKKFIEYLAFEEGRIDIDKVDGYKKNMRKNMVLFM